jgi:hypothetical protein
MFSDLQSSTSQELSQKLINAIVDMRLHTDQQLNQLFQMASLANQNTLGPHQTNEICRQVQ